MATGSRIDLNADLGEGYGPLSIGNDANMMDIVTSANIACGGHAGDTNTMFASINQAMAKGVTIGAHPGYADKTGFGRRIIPMTLGDIERMVALQISALIEAATLAGGAVRYVKAHGALANLGAEDAEVAGAIALATRAVSRDMALLSISGTELEAAGNRAGLQVFSEIFADRAYLSNGQLVPRRHPAAMIYDADIAAERLAFFLDDGRMPTLDGPAIRLAAQSICVHGDSPGAIQMARRIQTALGTAGITLAPFLLSA